MQNATSTRSLPPGAPNEAEQQAVFTLCRSCGETLNQDECHHTDDERAMIGTWVADEIRKALEMRYSLVEIIEIWQYDVEKYDPSVKTEVYLPAS